MATGVTSPPRPRPASGHDTPSQWPLGRAWGAEVAATTWTLNTLREWGLDASAPAGTADKLDATSRWEYEDLPYWGGEVDCCINAFTLANGAWLGAEGAPAVGLRRGPTWLARTRRSAWS